MTNSSWPALLWHHGSEKGKGACLRTPTELVATLRGKPLSPGSQPSGCLAYHTASVEHATQVRFTGTSSAVCAPVLLSVHISTPSSVKWKHRKNDSWPLNMGLDCTVLVIRRFFPYMYGQISPPYPWVLHPWIQPTLFSVCGWESGCGGPTAVFYTISHEKLEHLQILVSVGVQEPIPHNTKGQLVKFGGELKVHVNFLCLYFYLNCRIC